MEVGVLLRVRERDGEDVGRGVDGCDERCGAEAGGAFGENPAAAADVKVAEVFRGE